GRVSADMYYYFRRESVTSPVPPTGPGRRTLVIAMPHLGPDQGEGGVRLLLEQGSLRRRFDHIHLLTLEPDGHAAHAAFEPLVDGISHLGQLGLAPRARLDLARQVVEHTAASDLLVVNGKGACDLIPLLRDARPATRAAALFHDPGWGGRADTPAAV